jgi:hypothetical protein
LINLHTPVAFSIFIRPEVAKLVFERIREVQPEKLYIISDGPRTIEEESLVKQNRQQVEKMIDWECELNKIYYETNLGIDKIIKSSLEIVFKREEDIIFLEEDVLPSTSFFYFCQQLLEKYRYDNRIYIISGMNRLIEYPDDSDISYFFVDKCNYQGIAFWKRTFENFDYEFESMDGGYYESLIKHSLKVDKDLDTYFKAKYLKKHPNDPILRGEIWLGGINDSILYNSLAIVPRINLIKPIGDTHNSENSDPLKLLPKSMRLWSKMEPYDIDLDLKHPIYLVKDNRFIDKYRREFNNRKYIPLLSKIDRGFRVLIYSGPKRFILKLKSFYHYSKKLNKMRKLK